MADILIFAGKGSAQEKIDALTQQLQVTLYNSKISVEIYHHTGSDASISSLLPQLMQEHKLLLTVGYTASLRTAQGYEGTFVAALPDIPGNDDAPYPSALDNLAIIMDSADLLLVLDEPSRSLLEYRVPGAAGRVLVPANLPVLRYLIADLPPAPSTNILVSSHDFRFIADALDVLGQVPGVQIRLQEWDLADSAPVTDLRVDLAWADIVLCEWAGRNLVWYSQNLPAGKKLFARLHGFEADSVWIDAVNFAALEKLVVVSDFFKRKLVAEKGWAAEKIEVIGNTVAVSSLARAKRADAPFHLGLLGFTPLLKRPHLALEVLRLLLAKDSRFVLHLRGKSPWTYSWLWNYRVQEVDAYRQLYAAVAADPLLRQRVVFESDGSNVESWLTKIGWILSLSERETFHLAAVEGMASGAVPLFLPRDGVDEIFSVPWLFDSPQKIADFIAQTVAAGTWEVESQLARDYARRFDVPTAYSRWREVLLP